MSLRDEIHEQPAALRRLLAGAAGPIDALAAAVRARRVAGVMIAARGSSDHAGLYAKYAWGALARLPVALAAPSLFTGYGRPPRVAPLLVVGVSQSGQSPDVVGVLAEARRQGALTLAITNDPTSPLGTAAEWVIDTVAGPERAVAATKSYTTQLLAVAMLAAALADEEGDAGARRERATELARVPEWVEAALELEPEVVRLVARHADLASCVVLGRGYDFATAHEWALKLQELALVMARPFSSADFQHGPVAVVAPGFPVLAVAPGGALFDDLLALLTRLVRDAGVTPFVLSDRDEALALAPGTGLRLPAGVPEWLSPLVSMVPAQLFCLHLALAKGLDPERPRGLHKVTRTW